MNSESVRLIFAIAKIFITFSLLTITYYLADSINLLLNPRRIGEGIKKNPFSFLAKTGFVYQRLARMASISASSSAVKEAF